MTMTREQLLILHDAMCIKARNLMVQKNQDYADQHDPFGNLSLIESLSRGEWSTEQGIVIRISDKLSRLATACKRGLVVQDEGVQDTLLDIINYAVLYAAKQRDRQGTGDSGTLAPSVSAQDGSPPVSVPCPLPVGCVDPNLVYGQFSGRDVTMAPDGSFTINGLYFKNRLVYVMGPYSEGGRATPAMRARHTETAIWVGKKLAERGWLPHIPHAATHPLDDVQGMSYDDFMELDGAILNVCGAGFRFCEDVESPGAEREEMAMRLLRRPVWYNMGDVPMIHGLVRVRRASFT